MFRKITAAVCAVLMSVGASVPTKTHGNTIRWNWDNINTNNLRFSENFEWGVTTFAYEVDGYSINNSWCINETHIKTDGECFAKETSGIACDHWNRYKEDIQLMKEIGITTYCLSVDWSKIEPAQGIFNEQALQHYVDVCDELARNGIKVVIVFKDYRDPLWFAQAGAFEKEANIAHFEHYCLTVFTALQGRAYDFITFWTPDSYAMLGYWNNSIPPFKHDMQLAVNVLKNQLEAHVRVYQTLKAADSEKRIQVGITKHVHPLEPARPWHPLDRMACHFARQITDTSFYNFFTTGTFTINIPLSKWLIGAKINYKNPRAPQSIDFIGINYHSHGYIKGTKKVKTNNPKEVATDIAGMTIYAEGLYAAIKDVSNNMARQLNIPIYITQNGIATTDDSIRILHAEQHLYALSEACKRYNVRGYYHYSLMDGYMWGGYSKKFGLYAVDRTTLERTLKPGAQHLINTIKKFSAQA